MRKLSLVSAAVLLLSSVASAERYTLRVGSGHPAGPPLYATVMRDYLVPELMRRVAGETEHELRIIEGYSGSISSVAEGAERVTSSLAKQARWPRYADGPGTWSILFKLSPGLLFWHSPTAFG